MAEVAEWKALDSRELNQPSLENIKGVGITVYASPYDVPEAIRVKPPSGDQDSFIIEFRYIGGEETLAHEIKEGGVKLWLGRDSRRMQKICLDSEEEVDTANKIIDGLSGKPQSPPREGNYQLVKKVLSSLFNSPDGPPLHIAP